jgi:hypothetical protein
MRLKREDFEVLAQPSFLVALLVLVANDSYLKSHYPNWLTGKLSDFAGLYVFAQFVAVLSGVRIVWVAAASAVLFIAWKSPLASPLIELANTYSPLRIRRTVDYTDLAAIGVLPLAVRLYTARACWRLSFIKYPAAAFAMLGIMATSVLPPSYNVRFDLRDIEHRETAIGTTYAEVDKLLTQRGMHCTFCVEESSYREYFATQGNITVRLNYDSLDRKLFVSVSTYSPDVAKTRTDELEATLRGLLRPRFENVTVTRTSSAYEYTVPHKSTWQIKIETPSVGFPLSCAGNGINHPEIAKALAIFDDTVHVPTAINLRTEYCYPTDARCSLEMCRHSALGHVTGPNRFDRSIHANSRGYVGWGGTSLYLEIIEYGNDRNLAEKIADSLEARLRATLRNEIPIAVTRPVEHQHGARNGP